MSLMEIAKEDAFPAGTMKHFETGKMEILIANVGGKFYAINNRCPHMNTPLSMVVLQGTTVICPLHFSRFDVTTGKKSSGPGCSPKRGNGSARDRPRHKDRSSYRRHS